MDMNAALISRSLVDWRGVARSEVYGASRTRIALSPTSAACEPFGLPASGRVPEPLEAVEDEIDAELVPAHVVVAGLGLHVLLDVLGEVRVFGQELPPQEARRDAREL